jgi:hypothetical protein
LKPGVIQLGTTTKSVRERPAQQLITMANLRKVKAEAVISRGRVARAVSDPLPRIHANGKLARPLYSALDLDERLCLFRANIAARREGD